MALALARDWLAAGHPVSLITLSDGANDAHPIPEGARRLALGCQEPSRNPAAAIGANLRRTRRIRRAIRQSGARQVVSFLAATNILSIVATRGLGVHLVVSERNDPARQPLGAIWERLRRALYKRADAVTANSRQALVNLAPFVPLEKLIFVPNPLPGWAREAPPAPEAREPIILSVGRLHAQKAHDRLIRAFAASKAPAHGWRLVILGEGPERAALEALAAELALGDDAFALPGHVAAPRNWYARASIFALLSRYEGTANAVIEAMAAGLPVLLSEACGDASAFVQRHECGLVVDANDTESAARTLDLLIEDEALREFQGLKGRAAVLEQHAPERVRAAWERALGRARR